MAPVTRARVERVLEGQPKSGGVVVVDRDFRVLAERPPMPGGGATLVVLDLPPRGTGEPESRHRPRAPRGARAAPGPQKRGGPAKPRPWRRKPG